MKHASVALAMVTLLALPLFVSSSGNITSVSTLDGTASVEVKDAPTLPVAMLDLELYDPQTGQKVEQAYLLTDMPHGAVACTWHMHAPAGTYVLKTGIFSSDWSSMYDWNDNAAVVLGPLYGDNSIRCNGESKTAPMYISISGIDTALPNRSGTFTTIVETTQTIPSAIIDTELYKDGTQVGQWYEKADLQPGVPLILPHSAVTPATGMYTLKVGIFSSDWTILYDWNDLAGSTSFLPTSK